MLRDRYQLLDAGSALGFGCGPLLVAKPSLTQASVRNATIAIPGRYTTAALLLELCLGKNLNLVQMPFERIMPAVERGEVGAGLIIHESRFTYPQHGLVSLIDLGEWWEKETGMPIPLGGIVASKALPDARITAFDNALRESVAYANNNPSAVEPFMRKHAQEMDSEVMHNHVKLYVNDFTLNLGDRGRAAIQRLEQAYDAL